MIWKQPTLLNFSEFQFLNLFCNQILISKNNIIHTNRVECKTCGSICNYNGSSNKGCHALTKSNNSYFQKGQQYCPICDKTIQVENPWIDNMIYSLNQFIYSQIISLCENLSEDEIASHLESTCSIKISKSTVHNIIEKSNNEFENLDFDIEIKPDYYGYDEQYLKIDGKRAYRIIFFDINSNKVIYEKIHYKFSKKILKKILQEVFSETKPKGFVVDMKSEYPNAFKEIFGKKIKVQFCIFHLNQLILKEYIDSLKIGKNVKWTLMDQYNMYSLFNIFYDRSSDLKILKKFMVHFENFKSKLNSNKVEFYSKKYNVKTKSIELKKVKIINIIEKKMIKSFRKIMYKKRLYRKKNKLTLPVRSIDSAKNKFKEIKEQKLFFPKLIQKRIERIETNFEYFIGSETEILTNNKLEGFFGSTLKKFRKKSRKSLISFSALLKRKRAKSEGIEFYHKFTFFDLAKIFTACVFFAK